MALLVTQDMPPKMHRLAWDILILATIVGIFAMEELWWLSPEELAKETPKQLEVKRAKFAKKVDNFLKTQLPMPTTRDSKLLRHVTKSVIDFGLVWRFERREQHTLKLATWLRVCVKMFCSLYCLLFCCGVFTHCFITV